MNEQRIVDWIDHYITDRSKLVITVFLVVTVLFSFGLGNIGTEAGTDQFTSDLPAERAFTQVNEDFSPTFQPDTGSSQLIQEDQNVVSRQSMLRMLRTMERIEDRPDLRMTSSSSAAGIVAQQLDPEAETLDEQVTAMEQASDAEVRQAVRRAAEENPSFTGLLSNDFNRESARATATVTAMSHELPAGLSEGAGQGGSSPLTPIQQEIDSIVENSEGNIWVFGTGIVAQEFNTVITDSMLITVPAAVIVIVFFLVIAYRDLMDLLAGIVALAMAVIWTFGFLGLAGIPFSQMLIAVPPLLLAVGIDFGIHAVNRYREERVQDRGVTESMRLTTNQVLVAFFIVTGTTVIGFAANTTSALGPIQDFGLVAAIGIVFTFLIFGVFLPALKVWLDQARERYPIPTLSETPLGSEGSALGDALRVGVVVADRIPTLFLLAMVLLSVGAGYYATGVESSFDDEDFLPPEDNPDWMSELPEPFRPNEYSIVGTLNFLEENFDAAQSDSTTVYIQRPMQADGALEEIHRTNRNPPDSFVTSEGRQADVDSIVTVIQDQADRDPEFAAVVDRNDQDGDGVPDENLDIVYDALLDSPARDQALQYMTDDRRSTRVVYTIDSEATQAEATADTQAIADRFRYSAIATGQLVVFEEVNGLILESAITSLIIALGGASLFLFIVYRALEKRATLGVANMVPILVTVTLVAGTMRYFGIPFNALTATILSITIGIGIDYSVHITHRYIDERHERPTMVALDRTVRGTGGALLGSMLTTAFGIGVLALALFPVIGQFGVLTAISIFYAFITSIIVLPSALVLWDRLVGPPGSGPAPDLSPGESVGRVNPDADPDPSASGDD